MECSIKNCIITRLITALISVLLAIVTTVVFAIGLIPLVVTVFPYTAGLGALLLLAVFISIVTISSGCSNRSCMLCLGLMAFVAALLLLVLSVVGLAIGVASSGLFATIFIFFLSLTFWMALISFVCYGRCLAFRPHM